MFGTRPSAPSKKDDDYGMPQLKQPGGGGGGDGFNSRAMSAPIYQKQTSGLFSSDPYGGASNVSAGLAIFGRNEAPAGALVPSGVPIANGGGGPQQHNIGHPASIVPLGHPPPRTWGMTEAPSALPCNTRTCRRGSSSPRYSTSRCLRRPRHHCPL